MLIGKREFAVAAFDPEHEAFVVHIAILSIDLGDKVHSLKKGQIVYLKVDKVPIKVLSEYTDFANNFLPKLTIEFSEHTGINNYIIKLVDD